MKSSTLIYSNHPAFSDLTDALPLSSSDVDEFNICYDLAEKRGDLFKYGDFTNHLQNLLKNIFDDLEASASKKGDDNLRFFIRELYVNASQLLIRDLQEKLLCSENYLRIYDSKELSARSHLQTNQMINDKYFNGVISDSVLQQIKSLAKPEVERLRNNHLSGKISRESLSSNSGEYISQIVNIINTEFERIGVNHSVSIYCSRPMYVGGLGLELSVPDATWWKDDYACYENSPKTLYMHTDESIGIPKAIVYLTDVSEENGAFSTVPNALDLMSPSPLQLLLGRIIGSVGRHSDSTLYSFYQHHYHKAFGCPKYRKHFMSLPEQLQYNSHFGWDVVPNSSLEKDLIAQEVVHCGKAGFYTVFDGSSLVHRGGLVRSGERVALQVLFIPFVKPTLKRRLASKTKSLIKKFISK